MPECDKHAQAVHNIKDERLITGQNPQSARQTAEKLRDALAETL